MKPKPRVNNVDDISSEAATIGTFAAMEEQGNQIDAMMQRHSIYDSNDDSNYDDIEDNCVAVISDSDSIRRSGDRKDAYSIRKHWNKGSGGFGERLQYYKGKPSKRGSI